MLPTDLKADQFSKYPPLARSLVIAHLATFRQLPLGFVPSLLSQLIDYDYKFPLERAALDREIDHLGTLRPPQSAEWFGGFTRIRFTPTLEQCDWINQPAQFIEQLSAYLWSTHQLDAFREAAKNYGDLLQAATPPDPLPVRRLGIAVIGQGVAASDLPIFRNLREHGTYFGRVAPKDGLDQLLAAAAGRAEAHPVPYGHWYIDGGAQAKYDPLLTSISYQGLEPARDALLRNIQNEVRKPGMGPEELHSHLARVTPGELGMDGDVLLDRFQVKLLTEGSGTQIFSTTFAQWAAREALRRAQPLTLLVRFAPRQRQRPMNELLSATQGTPEVDPAGSLIDADMGAYYHWINQQRLPGSEQSAFLVWFEGHSQAIVVCPSLPRGTESSSALNLGELLALATA